MASLSAQKSGNNFNKPNGSISKKNPTPEEWAKIMFLAGFPDVQTVAEGLGVLENESGFQADPGGDGAHFGAWQEDSGFGSVADRLDPIKSTKAAYKAWKVTGSFHDKWGRWEAEQSGVDGATNSDKWKSVAQKAAIEIQTGHGLTGMGPGDLAGKVKEGGEDVIGVINDAEDFLTEAFHILTDFRKLGQLAAEATAWFIKLLGKALWDYVVAPAIHWTERAVSYYWINFFGTGTENGSGFGYRLRQNAGTVTILFWATGYAILWSDGNGTQMVEPHDSLLGQGIRGIEGAIAKRHLVKPKDVKKKTPKKPDPKTSSVPIERQDVLSVARKRPVTVQSQTREGRNHNGRSRREQFKPSPIARPGQEPSGKAEGKKLVVAKGYSRRAQKPPQNPKAAKPGKPGVGARPSGKRSS